MTSYELTVDRGSATIAPEVRFQQFSIEEPMRKLLTVLSLVLFIVPSARADLTTTNSLLSNGDFATGDLTGWTLFSNNNGSLGTLTGLPGVMSFDTDGNGVSNGAAVFQVGEAAWLGVHQRAGGGLRQSFLSPSGQLSIHLDIAVQSGLYANDVAGIFSVFVDNILLDTFNFESLTPDIPPYTTQRSQLTGSTFVQEGLHDLMILIERPVLTSDLTPLQYVDNVVVAIPEPNTGSLILIGLALVVIGFSAKFVGQARLAFRRRRIGNRSGCPTIHGKDSG
jgi:hypothetical protein